MGHILKRVKVQSDYFFFCLFRSCFAWWTDFGLVSSGGTAGRQEAVTKMGSSFWKADFFISSWLIELQGSWVQVNMH